jgi:hypothetical protein
MNFVGIDLHKSRTSRRPGSSDHQPEGASVAISLGLGLKGYAAEGTFLRLGGG